MLPGSSWTAITTNKKKYSRLLQALTLLGGNFVTSKLFNVCIRYDVVYMFSHNFSPHIPAASGLLKP